MKPFSILTAPMALVIGLWLTACFLMRRTYFHNLWISEDESPHYFSAVGSGSRLALDFYWPAMIACTLLFACSLLLFKTCIRAK